MPAYGAGLYGGGLWPGLAPHWPELVLEWAPGYGPMADTPTWVDITDRVFEMEWSYGRNDETGEFEAGQGHVILENSDRAFDPTFTAGPWYGQIKPRRQFRARAVWDGVYYPRWRAHSRGYPQSYPFETSSLVRVELADMLALLNSVNLDTLNFNRPLELASDRLDAIMDAAEVPDSLRDFGISDIEVGATDDFTQDLGTAAEQVQGITEFSWSRPTYVNRDGKFRFD